jgi:hypothetical protein
VRHFAFSGDGVVLVTCDYTRVSGKTIYRVKIWKYAGGANSSNNNSASGSNNSRVYVLHTESDLADGCVVSALSFHPYRDLFVVCDTNGQFWIWEFLSNNNTLNINNKSSNPLAIGGSSANNASSWINYAPGHYRQEAIVGATFSKDGSLLVIVYRDLLTFWYAL